MKNATGYDLRHLFIGAEGTLGFVVEADIRLLQAPPPQRVMVLGVDRFIDILEVLQSFHAAVTVSAFEFFSESALRRVLAHRDVPRPFASPGALLRAGRVRRGRGRGGAGDVRSDRCPGLGR